MCAIVDANVAHEVFGSNQHPAGEKFLDWITYGRGRLVAGGKLLKELRYSSGFIEWAAVALSAGRMRTVSPHKVEARAERLQNEGRCKSNDHHVIALAQLSSVRLLYSNDADLQADFTAKSLVDNPRGKVYSTRVNTQFTPTHKSLLNRRDLCQTS